MLPITNCMSSFRISCSIILDQIKSENKKIQLLLLLVLTASIISAQTIDELRVIKAAKAAGEKILDIYANNMGNHPHAPNIHQREFLGLMNSLKR